MSRTSARERALFREVNERIRDVNVGFGSDAVEVELLCECSQIECAVRVTVPLRLYERVRAAEGRFLVARGHERPGEERVVVRAETYAIVSVRPPRLALAEPAPDEPAPAEAPLPAAG